MASCIPMALYCAHESQKVFHPSPPYIQTAAQPAMWGKHSASRASTVAWEIEKPERENKKKKE